MRPAPVRPRADTIVRRLERYDGPAQRLPALVQEFVGGETVRDQRVCAVELLLGERHLGFGEVAFTEALAEAGVAISMDGRGRWMDNVFIERLWRSLKYEDVYLKGYADGREALRGIAGWIVFYNERRPHQALADRTPMAVWREAIAGDGAVDLSLIHI